MKDNLNGRQPQWNKLHGRRPQLKTTSIEDELNLRLEDDFNERQPQ